MSNMQRLRVLLAEIHQLLDEIEGGQKPTKPRARPVVDVSKRPSQERIDRVERRLRRAGVAR